MTSRAISTPGRCEISATNVGTLGTVLLHCVVMESPQGPTATQVMGPPSVAHHLRSLGAFPRTKSSAQISTGT